MYYADLQSGIAKMADWWAFQIDVRKWAISTKT